MSFKIQLQNNTSPKNKVGKSLTNIKEIEGTLRDNCSIINPKILIKIDDVSTLNKCNYMTIGTFGRKYFITDIVSYRNHLVEISGHVDVLDTYSTDIKKNEAIISRYNSTELGNTYLDDRLLATYQDSYCVSYNFPGSFPKSSENLVLAVAGASQS